MDIFNPLSLDDPEFFQKLNSARPDLFDQEEIAKLIEKELGQHSELGLTNKKEGE